VTAHLLKLEVEGVVLRESEYTVPAVEARWRRA